MAESAELPVPNSALIIDDAATIRRLLRRVLVKMGVPAESVADTGDGLTGFRLFREQSPDLVFLDLVLEGVQGTEIGQMILDQDPDARIILVTALDPDDERVRSLVSQGVLAVLEKPLDPSNVRDVVEEVFIDASEYDRIPIEGSP